MAFIIAVWLITKSSSTNDSSRTGANHLCAFVSLQKAELQSFSALDPSLKYTL